MSREFPPKIERVATEGKILSYQDAVIKIRESREKGLRVVLASGVFDIVHIGHLDYLRAAKLAGDLLFVGVESDDYARLNKGEKRPFNTLNDRLEILSEFQFVDFVFGYDDVPIYSESESLKIYPRRYRELNPNLIAVTSWNPVVNLKKRQAKEAGVELLLLNIERRDSTTRFLQLIGYE
jgi:cytidyltransferase-like protein